VINPPHTQPQVRIAGLHRRIPDWAISSIGIPLPRRIRRWERRRHIIAAVVNTIDHIISNQHHILLAPTITMARLVTTTMALVEEMVSRAIPLTGVFKRITTDRQLVMDNNNNSLTLNDELSPLPNRVEGRRVGMATIV
jgi:hypothetical protein